MTLDELIERLIQFRTDHPDYSKNFVLMYDDVLDDMVQINAVLLDNEARVTVLSSVE